MNQTPNTVSFTTFPLTLVQRSIEPDLTPLAHPRHSFFLPLADIDSPSGCLVRTFANDADAFEIEIRDLEGSIAIIDFFDLCILEEFSLTYLVIKVTVFILIENIANLSEPFTKSVASE